MNKRPLTTPPVIIHDTAAAKYSAGQCDCACDCACSFSLDCACSLSLDCACSFSPGVKLPENDPLFPSLVESGSFSRPNSHTLTLDNDHAICYGFHHTPMVLNHAALNILSLAGQPNNSIDAPSSRYADWGEGIVQATVKQMLSLGLLMPAGYIAPVLTETPTILPAWLHITDRCNMHCSYCYLPHKQADMSAQVGRAAINAIFRSALSHGYSEVKLKYAGGEPLFCFPLITELHQQAQSLSNQHDLTLDGVVLSNGTLLTPDVIETMQLLDLRLMISLDGIGDYHDCQRHFSDGEGSFDAVARSVDMALSYGLIPDISITVSGRNADGLPQLMAWLLERDLPFSLNFYRENDLSASHADLQLEEERIIAGMRAAYKVIEANLPRRSLLASLADRANLSAPHLRTCSVGHSYLVFDPLGRVAKCQMDMGHTITDVNDPDPLTTMHKSTTGICNLSVDEKAECRDCQWRYWCAGGCSLQTYRATGRYDVQSPNCNIYRALYPEVLRLEGLRLLRYAGEFETS